jgi:outer membrane protein OmpA-like peptidoglycan-associated protein
MKFAGYKIADGKISLDLQYKVRNSQLEGANQIVIDKLTLGERVDSPDAFKLPLELAIAILKDSDGRIDLGLPVSGSMDDPQFSYGALIWKAFTTLLTKIVTAPFRALGSMFGISGEKLESINFDPGSDRLLPPEREKLKQVAQALSKRPQLKLSVPGQYSEAADGAALKARAVRVEIDKRAGVKVEAGEAPGPLDLSNRAVRGAMRDLYAERFGAAELDKQMKAAEGGAAAPAGGTAAADGKPEPAQEKLPILQRVGKMVQGEPQVADATPFYHKLQERLEQNQPLESDALTQLGARRTSAILAALTEAGVDPARAAAAAPEKVDSDVGKPVPLKLALAAK